jgi:hypothetical protein
MKERKAYFFDIEEEYMSKIYGWCECNVNTEDWDYIHFGFSGSLRLYEPSDVTIFKLKFASMYTDDDYQLY